jgi:hypothetical protein
MTKSKAVIILEDERDYCTRVEGTERSAGNIKMAIFYEIKKDTLNDMLERIRSVNKALK